ncbi:MAG: PEGA domain-containing protein [Kofleriaceae bacterium]
MPVSRAIAVALACALLATAPAAAQPQPPTVIAVAPLTMLGAEDTSATAQTYQAAIAKALAARTGATVISAADVVTATKKAKKPALRACDGDAGCLAELGALVGATTVVFGEVGGLGDVQVLSLGAVDVSTRKELRRTRVTLGAAAEGGVDGAVTRLFVPDQYLGQLELTVSVPGASIYVDGKRLGKAPLPMVRLAVGAHALRITHPEHRDYVRFVDIGFDAPTPIKADLEPFATVESSVAATGAANPAGPVTYVDHPPRWYRRWWAVTGFAAIALGSAIAIGASLEHPLDADGRGTVSPP